MIDRDAFGDLFLIDQTGRVHRLDVGSGDFTPIAESVSEFRALAVTPEKQEEWFQKEALNAATERSLIPGPGQCIGFRTPVVFSEGGGLDSAYIADLYEHVSFLGDLHQQISTLPDGARVRLIVQTPKKNSL